MLYRYTPDRKGEHPQRQLAGWTGALQADGYAGFNALYETKGSFTAYQRVDFLTETELRRNYSPAEKVRMVEEAFRTGVVVTGTARRFGAHESLLYGRRWLMTATGTAAAEPSIFVAVTIAPEPIATEAPLPEPPEPLPAPVMPAASPAAILEVILSGGARLRLEGPVDLALAAAVVGAQA